jgi:hypothetical protein
MFQFFYNNKNNNNSILTYFLNAIKLLKIIYLSKKIFQPQLLGIQIFQSIFPISFQLLKTLGGLFRKLFLISICNFIFIL